MVSERKGTWFLTPTWHPLKLLTSKLLHYCNSLFIMAFTARISGSVFAIDPIFSPDGYARTVFQNNIDNVDYEVNGKELLFTYKRLITLGQKSDLKNFVERLIPDSTNGRKVNVNIQLEN